jgi:ADP-ribose pyrophosphatase YjhB (NUDIX family)
VIGPWPLRRAIVAGAAAASSNAAMSDLTSGDFLGAFGVVARGEHFLLVGNDRTIAGEVVRTWDLPGGRVEPGELLGEALRRELCEETGLVVRGEPRFLFVQEGLRRSRGQRAHAWRSFFFGVDVEPGEPCAANEVLAVRWMSRAELRAELTAPYHDSFRQWLEHGGVMFTSEWSD